MKGIKRNKTVIVFAITTSLAIGVIGCDGLTGKTDQEHVAAAKDFLDKDDLKSSVIELKGALQKNPENAEARRLLGEANLDLRNGPAAEKELRRALELGVAIEAIVGSLAESLAMQGKFQEILDEIDAPSNLDPVEKAEIISYRGDAWLSKNKPEKAKIEYQRALQIDVESGAAKLGLAKLAVANKERAEAEKLIGEALKSSPEDSNIWLFHAELQRAKGEIDKAEESYGQAIKLNDRNLMARYQRALLRIGKKDFDAAEKDINVLKSEVSGSFQRHYAEGLLAIYTKKFPEAEAALDQAIKLNGNFAQAVFYRGVAHLAQNHLAQAEKDLSRIQATFPNAIKPRQLLAQVRIQKREYKEAKELLDPVIKFSPDDPITLNLMGNIEFALGNIDQGMEYLQKLAELKPDDAGVRARLGLGLLQSGEQVKGIKQLEQAGELAPNFQQGDAFIVMAHLKEKEYAEAEKVIGRIKAKHPKSPLAGNLTGILNQAKGDQPQAKKAFESVLVEFPGNPAAANALADMALKEKNYVAVRKFYNSVLAKRPKHLKTKLRFAALEALEGKPKELEALLKSAIEDSPNALSPRLILSRFYTRFGQPGRAQTLLEEVKPQFGRNLQLLSALFTAQLADKNRIRALDTAKKLTTAAPQSAQAQFMLASAYEVNRDTKNMRVALSRSLELDPKHTLARMAMVKLLILEGKQDEAAEKLVELDRDFPGNLAILELQGWQAAASNKLQEAQASYKKLLEKQPTTKSVIALVKVTSALGDKTKAIEILSTWLDNHPADVSSRYLLSGFYSKENRQADAQAELEKIIELQPENILALNDLAWALRKSSPAKALEQAEKAYEMAPKFTPVMDTLAMVLLENGQTDRAVSLLEQVVERSPKAPIHRYHLAIAMQKNERTIQAIEKLNALLKRYPTFEHRSEAEALLKQWKKK